jgi:hypothetical protein
MPKALESWRSVKPRSFGESELDTFTPPPAAQTVSGPYTMLGPTGYTYCGLPAFVGATVPGQGQVPIYVRTLLFQPD